MQKDSYPYTNERLGAFPISTIFKVAIQALFYVSFLALALYATAQDAPNHGRLPDGRAFRTDSEGAQLVDYIAELEQNLVEQNRKVISLEDENVSLKTELAHAKAGHSDKVEEKDLIKSNSDSQIQKSAAKESWLLEKNECAPPEKCECPKAAVLPAIDCENTEKHSNLLRAQIGKLEQELVMARRDRDRYSAILQQNNVKAAQNISDQNKQNSLLAQIEEQNRIAIDKQSELQIENEKLEDELIEVKAELDKSSEAAKKVDAEIAQNRLDLGNQKSFLTQIEKLERELVAARADRDNFSAKLQQLSAKAGNATAEKSNVKTSLTPDLEDSRQQAVDAIKSRMKKELQLLISRKDERDVLFAKYLKERKGGISLYPSSLRARSGRELSQLDELLTKAETVRELAILRVDLEEIRRQMADDLALVERMSKL